MACLRPCRSRRWHQAVASTSLLHHDETVWRCMAAPEPAEVLWGSVGMRLWERQTRTAVVRVLHSLLLLTYAIPVSALQAGLQVRTAPRYHHAHVCPQLRGSS